jgi:hypothetical protein
MVLSRQIRTSAVIKRLVFVPLILLAFPVVVSASAAREAGKRMWPETGWSTFLGGGYVHQFKTDMDDGGRFSSDRLSVRGGVTYASNYRCSASLSLGYGFDRYDFSGNTGFAALRPWEHINSYRVSVPVRAGFKDAWTVFLIPTLQSFAENGADLDDGMRGGGFVGISYRFGDRLTLGPGIGVMSQIEDNATVFPVLIVKWKITDRLSLETGRGLGATLGPGLVLRWMASDKWDLAVGGRYEKLRFRLDKKGIAPKGVGQDKTFPLFAGVSYHFSRRAQVSLLGGADLGGELRLEDKKGDLIAKDNYDTAGFGGITFNVRF